MSNIKFILEDGGMSVSIERLKKLHTDFFNSQLGGSWVPSEVVEIDVSLETFDNLLTIAENGVTLKSVVTQDMVKLADYLGMRMILPDLWKRHTIEVVFVEKVKQVHYQDFMYTAESEMVPVKRLRKDITVDELEFAVTRVKKINVQHDDHSTLLRLIFEGLDLNLAVRLAKKHFGPRRLRNLVCLDDRCTRREFKFFFDPSSQKEEWLDGYVKRGLLNIGLRDQFRGLSTSQMSAARIVNGQLTLPANMRYPVIKDDKPMKSVDELARIAIEGQKQRDLKWRNEMLERMVRYKIPEFHPDGTPIEYEERYQMLYEARRAANDEVYLFGYH